MNTKNNRRRLASREKIETAFIEFLQTREISQITVADLCKTAKLNRSTFYANYVDIYGLADTIRDRLEGEVNALYENDMLNNCGNDYLRLFRHIKENQGFYITYFKLGYDSKHTIDLARISQSQRGIPYEDLDYHIAFYKAGLNAIIKKWLASGCKESPETMVKILEDEYKNRH